MAFRNKDVETVMRTIFRRCLECPSDIPSCPVCEDDEVCSYTPTSCNECAQSQCIKNPDPSPTASVSGKSNGPNVGAIAGGVVGGVAFIVIMTFVVWRYCLKGRRQKIEEMEWEEEDTAVDEKTASSFTMRRDARASTHTVASLASTVLTRASNIIQIAYIPGVTNRSGPHSPGLLVPPVPPIPIATTSSTASTPYSTEDQHFFVPGDLRDSTYSGYTDYSDNRTSIAPSLARSSVATTIYRNNAIISPMPAQTVVRGKAAVVSVKSGSSSPLGTPHPDTPPVPEIDPAKIVKGPIKIQMPASTDAAKLSPNGSVRSTATATMGKPTALTITKGKVVPVRSPSSKSSQSSATTAETPKSEASSAATTPRPTTSNSFLTSDSDSDSDTEPDHARSRRSLLREANDSPSATDSPPISQSPFADMSSSIRGPDASMRAGFRNSVLSTVIEGTDDERSRRNSRNAESPFDDKNAVGRP